MSRRQSTTSPSSNNGGGPRGAVQTCSGSEILIVDELGLPVASSAVIVRPGGGGPLNMTTDGTGKIRLNVPPGTSVEVEIADIHETAAGDSTNTASGQHFKAGGTGP
jgi:hypothetical protein